MPISGLVGPSASWKKRFSRAPYHLYTRLSALHLIPGSFPSLKQATDSILPTRFKIKDDEIGRDPLAAWACIRLDRLREGYRLVRLHDCSGEKTGGVLLVKIIKQFSERYLA